MLPALAKFTLTSAALLELPKVQLLLSAELEFSFSFSAPWVEVQKEYGMLRWPWSSRHKHPVPRVLGCVCVTAAEIPSREGWERQDHPKQKQGASWAASIAKGRFTCLVLLGATGRESLSARGFKLLGLGTSTLLGSGSTDPHQ